MIIRLSKISFIGIVFIFTLYSTLFAACPPDYPIDCGNGYCCPLDYPVCLYGENEGMCGKSPSACPSVEIYGEGSEEVEILRSLRDNALSTTPEGQELIRLYYQWSPAIVEIMEENEGFKEDVEEIINGVLELTTEVE